MFVTTKSANLYEKPGKNAHILAQLGSGHPVPVTAELPILQDEWLWYRIEGPDALWIPLQDSKGNLLAAEWVGPNQPPAQDEAPPSTASITYTSRVHAIAFNITSRFEGGAYHTYQNYDKGIVSYGRFQFTIESGSLAKLLNIFIEQSNSESARTLEGYLERVRRKDETLRSDEKFKTLLLAAAKEPAMQVAQDNLATEMYWDVVQRLSAEPRGILLPLSHAMLFDMAINHGTHHAYINLAEEEFGLPTNIKTRVPDNGVTEEQLIRKVAEVRQYYMYRLAEKKGYPGLKVRADFWLTMLDSGDWQLMGDSEGNISVKNRPLQIRPVMLIPLSQAALSRHAGGTSAPNDIQPAPEITCYITPIDDRINLRSEPNTTTSTIIGTVGPDDTVGVVEPYEQAAQKLDPDSREWITVVRSDGTVCYTAAWLYTLVDKQQPPKPEAEHDEITEAPGTATESEAPATATDTQVLWVQPVEKLNLRNAGSFDAETIGLVAAGKPVMALEPYSEVKAKVGKESQWLRIKTEDNQTGYIAAWYCELATPPQQAHQRMYVAPEDVLNVRDQASLDGTIIGKLARGTVVEALEPAETVREKLIADAQWLHVRMPNGKAGYVAAWYCAEAAAPKMRIPPRLEGVNITGVNLDAFHPLGSPDPNRLGDIGWVRFLYNVSLNPDKPAHDPDRYGNTDLDFTFRHYQPVLERYAQAGKKVLLVCTHQTYGEGAGFNWEQMTPAQWKKLSDKFVGLLSSIASQYAGKNIVHAYQIWNEMDAHSGARASVPLPAKDYGYMLANAIKAVRAADPDALVITGGHASGTHTGPKYALETLAEMHGLLPDGIAFHPYGRGPNDAPQKYCSVGHIEDSISAYAAVHPDLPLWITEWGVLNAPDEPPRDMLKYAQSTLAYLKNGHPDKIAAAIWFAWAQGMDNGYGIVDQSDRSRGKLTDQFIKL